MYVKKKKKNLFEKCTIAKLHWKVYDTKIFSMQNVAIVLLSHKKENYAYEKEERGQSGAKRRWFLRVWDERERERV